MTDRDFAHLAFGVALGLVGAVLFALAFLLLPAAPP